MGEKLSPLQCNAPCNDPEKKCCTGPKIRPMKVAWLQLPSGEGGRHGENTLRQGYVIEKPELSGAAGAVTKRTPRADRSGKEEAGGSAPPGGGTPTPPEATHAGCRASCGTTSRNATARNLVNDSVTLPFSSNQDLVTLDWTVGRCCSFVGS